MSTLFAPSERVTRFSEDRVYRYELWRSWDDAKPFCCFIGLNPSTADEIKDDPTIRKCIGFAKRWGYGALCMLNLFPLVATDPKELIRHPWKYGEQPVNGHAVLHRLRVSPLTVCAWGTNVSRLRASVAPMMAIIDGSRAQLHCFRLTKEGYPEHPLYMPYETGLIPFEVTR